MIDFINYETVGLMLFFIGLYGLLARRNIIKTIISLGIMQSGIMLFFLNTHFKENMRPPSNVVDIVSAADPIPQALMITAIIIGITVTAVSLTMFISLYHRYGTTNWEKVLKRRGGNEE